MIRYFFAKFDKYCLFVLIINLFYDILTFIIIIVNILILLYLYKNKFFGLIFFFFLICKYNFD